MASIAESVSFPRSKTRSTVLDVAAGRILSAILTLLVIAFLAYWGLTMASRAVEGLPADPVGSAALAVELTINHFIDHPSTYFVHREDIPAFVHIGTLLRNSLVLLLPALAIAFAAGVPLGMAAARRHTRGDRWEGFSVINAMSAKIGFNLLNVEAVIELSGVGGGTGNAIAMGQGTSYRLSRLLEAAAGKFGVRTTTRGTDAHFGLPKPIGYGQRDALSANTSWDGSDAIAHLPGDTLENIEPDKLRSVGETLSLFLTVLARETQY